MRITEAFESCSISLKKKNHRQASADRAHFYRAERKPLKVLCGIDESINSQVIGDKNFINQIITNLLGNAFKFTSKGFIKLSLTKLSESKKTVNIQFKIQDTGIGIEKSKLANIFDSFRQADKDTNLLYGGTGLGLSIAKHLVEMHGGKIEVESTLNIGTTFTLTIPFGKTTEPLEMKTQDSKKVERKMKGIKVLVAEDNLMNQKFLTKILDQCQIQYTVCDDGKQALKAAEQHIYDLIFMDVQMPVMDGYSATKAIRKLNNANKNIPIVALTASALIDERKKALACGMNDYLSKPFTPDQLREVAENLIVKQPEISLEIDQKLLKFVPMGRFAEADEIADAVIWLASDQSKFITGQTITIDGETKPRFNWVRDAKGDLANSEVE